MPSPGANLPVVLQQAPDASRVQEFTQRAPELQQSAAAAEVQRDVRRDQTQVRQPHPSDAYNRIDPRQPRERYAGHSGRQKKNSPQPQREKLPRGEGGVVDVVV